MKALDLLITLRDDYIHGELDSDVNEAIEEFEDLQNENKSLVKTLEKYNEEMIELRKENHECLVEQEEDNV